MVGHLVSTNWSALVWAQVALAGDYGRMLVIRALHKAVRHVYCAVCRHGGAENTMRAVYAIAHHQTCSQHTVVARLIHWLHRNTQGCVTLHCYTDNVIPYHFRHENFEPTWCANMHLLRAWSAP